MIFVTADTHFNHANILEFCPNRIARDVNHMNQAIIQSINEVVKPTDELYFVGDFAMKGNNDEAIPLILKQIACKHTRLVFGNHDKHRHGQFFEQSYEMVDVKENHQRYTLCHYAMASWRRGAFMLHGHWHGKGPTVAGRLDIGVDGPTAQDFRGPWSLAAVKAYIEDRDRAALVAGTLKKMFDERMRELDKPE